MKGTCLINRSDMFKNLEEFLEYIHMNIEKDSMEKIKPFYIVSEEFASVYIVRVPEDLTYEVMGLSICDFCYLHKQGFDGWYHIDDKNNEITIGGVIRSLRRKLNNISK